MTTKHDNLADSLRILLDNVISHGHFADSSHDHDNEITFNKLYEAIDTSNQMKYTVCPTRPKSSLLPSQPTITDMSIAQLRHPNLFAQIDSIELDCVRFHVFEHVTCDLPQWLRQNSTPHLIESHAKVITSQLLSVVACLHTHRLVHEKIDVQHVLVRQLPHCQSPLVKLILSPCFRIVKVSRWRRFGTFEPELMPDLWSIGALVHHLLGGRQTGNQMTLTCIHFGSKKHVQSNLTGLLLPLYPIY
jgi:hypothetical protein